MSHKNENIAIMPTLRNCTTGEPADYTAVVQQQAEDRMHCIEQAIYVFEEFLEAAQRELEAAGQDLETNFEATYKQDLHRFYLASDAVMIMTELLSWIEQELL